MDIWMHRCRLFCHNKGIHLDEYIQVTKHYDALHPSYPESLFLDVVKKNWIFFFLDSLSRMFTIHRTAVEGEAISSWFAFSVWLVSYVFSASKSLFTGGFGIVLVFAILTIAPVLSESLLGNTRVTMESALAPFHKN